MREELLHFIWRFRYFNQHELFTEAGEPLQIISPGELNVDQGPDFRNACVRIGESLFQGPVELHVNASDWLRHGHDGDAHYRDVVLHVVWENDCPADTPPGAIPMLVLGHRISKLLLGKYDRMMNSRGFIPCERLLPQVTQPVWTEWQRELSLDRLRQRALFIRDCLAENHQHWEETTWWLMARSLGQPVNTKAFEAIGRSLPLRLIVRHRSERVRLEALLLGQAGLLEGEFEEEYPQILQREYRFCRAKYGLTAAAVPVSFLRMRPGHFPGIRLAQLADLLSGAPGWFARIRDAHSPGQLETMLDSAATGYWEDHYVLTRHSSARPKRLGAAMKKGLLINAFIPMLFAYGWLRDEPAFRDKALHWLEQTGPETNTILTGWRRLGVTAPTAAASQALLELKKNYCDPKRCLDCAVGRSLLGRTEP